MARHAELFYVERQKRHHQAKSGAREKAAQPATIRFRFQLIGVSEGYIAIRVMMRDGIIYKRR